MSYVDRVRERVQVAGYTPKRTGKRRSLGIFSLGAVGGGDSVPFEEAIVAAQDALADLAEKAATVVRTTFNVQTKETARQVFHFATVPGAAKLQRAAANRDLASLQDLQRSVDSMMNISLDIGFVSGLVQRFLRFTILPPAVMSAEDVEVLKEIARTPVPGFPPPGKIPWYVIAGGAAVSLGFIGYFIRSLR